MVVFHLRDPSPKGVKKIEKKIESLIIGIIEGLGYELYDVIYEKEGQDYYLRIFIDKEEGISLEDCEKVNDAINDILDEANYIKEQYFLEVSSPGIERVIRKEKHLKASIGKEVTCNLFKAIIIKENKEKQIEGTLKSFDDEKIIIQVENEEIQIDKKDIAKLKLKYNWQ